MGGGGFGDEVVGVLRNIQSKMRFTASASVDVSTQRRGWKSRLGDTFLWLGNQYLYEGYSYKVGSAGSFSDEGRAKYLLDSNTFQRLPYINSYCTIIGYGVDVICKGKDNDKDISKVEKVEKDLSEYGTMYKNNNLLSGAGGQRLIPNGERISSRMVEDIYTNKASKRWATIRRNSSNIVDWEDHGQNGGTRIVGIYIDPLVESGEVVKDSDHDSQRRFQNDLEIDNLIVKTSGDFDSDGDQEVYWKTTDGTAYLRALMHADGNIQYANYQSEAQMSDYLTSNGYESIISDII